MLREILLLPDGQVSVEERPLRPDEMEPGPRQAIIRTVAGAVSAGTETTQIRQRREAPSAAGRSGMRLGYSVAGTVEAVGRGYAGPSVGTRVAVYGGPYVGYADRLIVGQNLIASAVGLPPEQAAFGGIGAIALHGVRMAGIELGQRVGVLGLGIIGQLASQLASAAGAWVLACDPLSARREAVALLGLGSETVSPEDWNDAVRRFTSGHGLDAVLVCAGTPDANGPAVTALEAVRYRGKIVIVGNVRTDWPREMLFQKEATVVVSRAAGPGRYDTGYERDGWDPPIGLTPWTEGRNLRCFIDLLASGRVQVAPLISEIVPMAQAADAYDRLMTRPQETLAVVLRF